MTVLATPAATHTISALPAGPVSFATGVRGDAAGFDGSSFLYSAAANLVAARTSFSIGAWVKNTGPGGADEVIAGALYPDFASGLTDHFGQVYAYVDYGANQAAGGPNINDGDWHRVIETFDGTTIRLYIDGVEVDSDVSAVSTTGTAQEFSVGARSILNNTFTGQIDEVFFATDVVTPALLPTVTGTNPSLSGGSLTAGATSLQVTFNKLMVTADQAANYELSRAGPDGLLGNGDDVIVPLAVSYNSTTNTATLTFAALPKDIYRLTVKDSIVDAFDTALDGDANGTAGGDRVRDFVGLPTGPIPYRWQAFNTYDNGTGQWMTGNNSALFGGVAPSNWTDNSYRAGNMSTDPAVLAALFTNKAYAGKNALVWSEAGPEYSSTNGRVVAALFRVQNTTGSAINWTPNFYCSAYSGWSEAAGVALNGNEVWNNGGASGVGLQASVTISLPANQTSTVIFTSTGGPTVSVGSFNVRASLMGFYNNSDWAVQTWQSLDHA